MNFRDSSLIKLLFVFLVGGIVLSMISRAYYCFVFLPRFHGSYVDSLKKIIDLEGFFAYVQTAPGAILTSGTFSFFAGAGICWLICLRKE